MPFPRGTAPYAARSGSGSARRLTTELTRNWTEVDDALSRDFRRTSSHTSHMGLVALAASPQRFRRHGTSCCHVASSRTWPALEGRKPTACRRKVGPPCSPISIWYSGQRLVRSRRPALKFTGTSGGLEVLGGVMVVCISAHGLGLC